MDTPRHAYTVLDLVNASTIIKGLPSHRLHWDPLQHSSSFHHHKLLGTVIQTSQLATIKSVVCVPKTSYIAHRTLVWFHACVHVIHTKNFQSAQIHSQVHTATHTSSHPHTHKLTHPHTHTQAHIPTHRVHIEYK